MQTKKGMCEQTPGFPAAKNDVHIEIKSSGNEFADAAGKPVVVETVGEYNAQ